MSELKVYKPYANRDGDMFLYHKGDEDLMLDDEDEIYLKSEADKVIAELKEERRWRSVSEEMPQNYDEGDYFLVAVEHESTICPKGNSVTIARLVGGQWSDDEGEDIDEDIEYDLENSAFSSQVPKGTKKGFYHSKVTHWMPLPSAPKEEK